MIEGDDTLVGIKDLPVCGSEMERYDADRMYHLSHLTAGSAIRALSCLGREPPERATVNLPFFSMDSFCAFTTKAARAFVSWGVEGKECSTGGLGGWCIINVVANGAQGGNFSSKK